ncbi:MAG: hypothetical protein SNJ75_01915 [Gemmataceae bacterium]
MRRLALLLGLALAAGVIGCRSLRKDLVESQLSAREKDVRTLQSELARSEKLNFDLLRELQALRGLPGPLGYIERPTPPYPVQSVRLGGLTSGRPNVALGGDDGLEVLIEVRDRDDQALKAPGEAIIDALEISPEGIKTPLAQWRVSVAELRGKWVQGLFNTGYRLELSFPKGCLPRQEKLRVVVRFTLLDGRIFEAEKDIRVRVVPEANRPLWSPPLSVPPMEPVPATVTPTPSGLQPPELPTPRGEPRTPASPAELPAPTPGLPQGVPQETGPALPVRLHKPQPWQS